MVLNAVYTLHWFFGKKQEAQGPLLRARLHDTATAPLPSTASDGVQWRPMVPWANGYQTHLPMASNGARAVDGNSIGAVDM